MENLLKAEKANPLDGNSTDESDGAAGNNPSGDPKEGDGKRRSSTVPMGDDDGDDGAGLKRLSSTDSDEETEDPFDHANNTRLAPKTRIELSQSKAGGEGALDRLDEDDVQQVAGAANYSPKRLGSRRQGGGAAARSMVVTAQERRDKVGSLHQSAGPKAMGRDAQRKVLRKSESMPTSSSDLERDLAMKDEKALRGSMKPQSRRVVHSKSMVVKSSDGGLRGSGSRRSSANDVSDLRRSSASLTRSSGDSLSGGRRSSTPSKGRGDGLRRSSAKHGSSDSLRQSSASFGSARGGSVAGAAGLRRSSEGHGSSENLRRSAASASRRPRSASRGGGSSSASMRKSSTSSSLRDSDHGSQTPSRRRSSSQSRNPSIV